MQETHYDNLSENEWKQEWEGKSIWNNGPNSSKGVAVLFKSGLNFEIVSENSLGDGRIISLKLKIDDSFITTN